MRNGDVDREQFERFHGYLGETFLAGNPIEVIDGDNDTIDDVSLPQVMNWVQDKRKKNK